MFNKLNLCTLALMLLTSSMSFSGPFPTNVVDPNYLYENDDISQVLANRLGNNPNIHIVQPVKIDLEGVVDTNVDAIVDDLMSPVKNIVNQDIKIVIPNFYGNSSDENGTVIGHWTAAVIRQDQEGIAKVYYNDPTGNPYQDNSQTLLEKIIVFMKDKLDAILPIVDLQVHQQRDGTSCGAFTAEDLVVLAEMNGDELTFESARALLANIQNAQALRNKHAGIFTQENRGDFENEEDVLSSAKDRKGEIIRAALRHALTDTHNSAMSAIHSRLSNGPLRVAADDDVVGGDTWQHGVWARASISHSKDKASNKTAEYFSGYKTKEHSNTIGIDSLINDNLLLGLAYTNAYKSIKPQNQNAGNVDKARTNMFSLYGSYNIPNYNWFVDGTISYAESVIRGKNVRKASSSKYKSHLYSGSVSLGYNYHTSHDIYITPSLGMTGSLIKDSGYKETGTNFQNLNVAKKHYNTLSSTLGVRTFKNINQGQLTITPELYSCVNYSLKNKTPSINAQLQGIDETLPTINFKSNKVDYNLGVGISLKHNMMEYGVNYTATFAKKYEAHSGSLKVRVNF